MCEFRVPGISPPYLGIIAFLSTISMVPDHNLLAGLMLALVASSPCLYWSLTLTCSPKIKLLPPSWAVTIWSIRYQLDFLFLRNLYIIKESHTLIRLLEALNVKLTIEGRYVLRRSSSSGFVSLLPSCRNMRPSISSVLDSHSRGCLQQRLSLWFQQSLPSLFGIYSEVDWAITACISCIACLVSCWKASSAANSLIP